MALVPAVREALAIVLVPLVAALEPGLTMAYCGAAPVPTVKPMPVVADVGSTSPTRPQKEGELRTFC